MRDTEATTETADATFRLEITVHNKGLIYAHGYLASRPYDLR